MIKISVDRYPIYGADISSGRVEVFHTSEEAVAFLTKSNEKVVGQVRLQQSNDSEALIPHYLISSSSSEEGKSDLIVSCEI